MDQDHEFRMNDTWKQGFEEQNIWHKYTVFLCAIFLGPKRGKWSRKTMHARMTDSGFTVLCQQQWELQVCIESTEPTNFLQQNCNCNDRCHCSMLMTLSGCSTEVLTINPLTYYFL